jgi:hypothetical protein
MIEHQLTSDISLKSEIHALEKKRERLHEYAKMKLDDHDYHGVADAAMDLRELDVEIRLRRDLLR